MLLPLAVGDRYQSSLMLSLESLTSQLLERGSACERLRRRTSSTSNAFAARRMRGSGGDVRGRL